jgi:hypothetical protein
VIPPSALRGPKAGLLTGLLLLLPCSLPALAFDPAEEFQVVVRSQTVHLRWSASVQERGGEFQFGPNLNVPGFQNLVRRAVEGVTAYEAELDLGAESGSYALIYRSASGEEVVLATVLVVHESFVPAASVEVSHLQRPVVEPFALILPHPRTPWAMKFSGTAERSSQPSPEPSSPPPRA